MDYFYGDSNTLGSASGIALPYPHLYEIGKRNPMRVLAVGGSCAADQADAIFAQSMGASDRAFYNIGLNDRYHYGGGAAALSLFDSILRAEITAARNNRLTCRQTGWTFTGTWTTAWDPFGVPDCKATTTNGSTASVQFTGDSFDLCYVQIDGNASNITMTVDGTAISGGAVQMAPVTTISTPVLARTYAPGLVHRSGFGAGTHTLVVTAHIVNDGGGWPSPVDLCWIASGSNGASFTLLSATNTTRSGDTALTAAYNAQLSATATTLGISYLDAGASVDPTKDTIADGIHMSNQGQVNYRTGMGSV